MKNYAKMVEAEQFIGDTDALQNFVAGTATVSNNEEGKVILITLTERWYVIPSDYVVKDFKGLAVYKASRFEAEFEEVGIEKDIVITEEFIQSINDNIQPVTGIAEAAIVDAPIKKTKKKTEE